MDVSGPICQLWEAKGSRGISSFRGKISGERPPNVWVTWICVLEGIYGMKFNGMLLFKSTK